MKKKRWIILIIVIVLAAIGFAAWRSYNDIMYRDPNGFDFNKKTGCYKVECGPMYNCQFHTICPGDVGYKEWRKGVEPVKPIKSCCSNSIQEDEICKCGGGTVNNYKDCYCGKSCSDKSIKIGETCKCIKDVVSGPEYCIDYL